MPLPLLEPSPAEGSRISTGTHDVSFGLGDGNSLRLSVGTSDGGSDVLTAVVSLPNSISLTTPAGASVLFCSAWITNSDDGTFHTYSWVYSVGEGTRAPAQVGSELVVGYLIDNWKRSKLAGFEQGLEVRDPGHGLDEISPVTYLGQPFNLEDETHVTPFSPAQVANRDTGTGYLRCLWKSVRAPYAVTPGAKPEYQSDMILEITIITPARNGPALASLYGGAIAMIFRRVSFSPGEAGISQIRNIDPPDERPTFTGDDGTFRYDTLSVPLSLFGRSSGAGSL